MKTALVLLCFFFLALAQCHVPEHMKPSGAKPLHKPEPKPVHKHDCKPTDACIDNGGYCIRNSKKKDCDGLLFPMECKSALCSCCVEVTMKRDECAAGVDTCPANSECQDQEIGYECACAAGFEQCGDMNECDSDPCGPDSQCQNTYGSYECVCNAGFEKVNGACVDIDECDSNPCGPNSVCSNSPGSFNCNCNAGYVFCDGTCVDDNECTRNPCPANSNCRNTNGSYECDCATGFTNQSGACVDINECNSNTTACSGVQKCVNTKGSYSCVCQQCSPQCDRMGIFLLDSVCVSLITDNPMTYDEADGRCGHPKHLFEVGSPAFVTILGSSVMLNIDHTAWIFAAPGHKPNDNGLCPVIVKNGTSFEVKSVPCNDKYVYAICQTVRLW